MENLVVDVVPGRAVDCEFHGAKSVGEFRQHVPVSGRHHVRRVAESAAAEGAKDEHVDVMQDGNAENLAGRCVCSE